MQSDQAVYSQGWVRAGSAQLWELASCSWVTARLLRLTAPAPADSYSYSYSYSAAQPRVLTSSSHCVTLAPASSWLLSVSAVALLLLLSLLLWC